MPRKVTDGAVSGKRAARGAPRPRKLVRLEAILSRCDGALVAFSGGVDSTFLLSVAREVLGDRVLAVTVSFPAVPAAEIRAARSLARRIGARHIVVAADEVMRIEGFASNPPDRCYHCKSAILAKLREVAQRRGIECLLEASNTDDRGDYRPGAIAVMERGVRSPLVEAGISKKDVRAFSRGRGLPTWNKPSAACLASRIPYGETITRARLGRIERAEAYLAKRGFRVVRVRDHGSIARIEAGEDDILRLVDGAERAAIARKLRSLGFRFVTFDLEGYRMGSLNESILAARPPAGPKPRTRAAKSPKGPKQPRGERS